MLEKPEEILYGYNDVTVLPTVISKVASRKECNPLRRDVNKLPIFTAPMSSVVGISNFNCFEKNDIIPILPRNESIKERLSFACSGKWAAFGMDEFETYFVKESSSLLDCPETIHALIDIANGHTHTLVDQIKKAKEKFGKKIVLMVGNIANPHTFIELSRAGADYVRCGIGGGSGCITASNTSIFFPMASLISEVYKIKRKNLLETKIIADGGIRNYSDVVKALALGADYVMIGGLFAGCLEACGELTCELDIKNQEDYTISTDPETGKSIIRYEDGKFYVKCLNKVTDFSEDVPLKLFHKFYGMASKQGQKDIGGERAKMKTSEGISKEIPVTITLEGWVENMKSYLRSAMSYCGYTQVEQMSQATCRIMSWGAQGSINK